MYIYRFINYFSFFSFTHFFLLVFRVLVGLLHPFRLRLPFLPCFFPPWLSSPSVLLRLSRSLFPVVISFTSVPFEYNYNLHYSISKHYILI